ncbi:hypothetical protein EJB05_26946, partial [Eragrostis curvula]
MASSKSCTNRSKCRTNNNQDGSSSTNPKMRVFHSPVRFCNVVKKIKESKGHVQAIESIGFGGLLQMPSISLRKNMLKDIADVYDISNRGFKLCGQIVRFPVEDVHNILGLEISGNDVMQYINEKMKIEDETVRSELFQRFASENNKLELQGLENMLHKDRPADGDFVRAFVLFTIGVLLASNTGPTIHWSYIEAFWYWERVRVANQHGIKYEERITRPPVMVFWNEENAKRRQTAWEKDGLDRGTLNLPVASHTKQKREATVSQAKYTPEGPSNQPVQSLEHWKKATKLELKLDLEQKLLELEHKQDIKFLEHKEFASFRNDSILEDRINNLEAKVTPRTRFHQAKDRIYDQSPIARNDTMETTMEQHSDPSITHIKKREPIIDDDYNTGSIDREAAMFLLQSYEDAWVVDIDDIRIKAGQLRRNVSQQYIFGEVINAYVQLSDVENDTASFISTFDVQKLADTRWELTKNYKKRIADKCKGKHLVFVPMNINGNHWGLLVLNFIKHEVQILESLSLRDEELEMTLKEAYLLENPDEREGHRHDSDVEDLLIISSATETQSKGEAITASGTTMTRRPRGRPRKIRVDEVSAKVPGIEEGTPKVKGVTTRKRAKGHAKNLLPASEPDQQQLKIGHKSWWHRNPVLTTIPSL